MARETMGSLIDTVRALIGDSSDEPHFDDDAIQRVADENRLHMAYQPLAYELTLVEGVSTFLTYTAPLGDWEGDFALVDGSYSELTPEDADLHAGRFTFASSTPPPVLLSGNTYDIYATGADLLEEWSAAVAQDFDFSADGSSFQRSQKMMGLKASAASMRSKARVWTGQMVTTGDAY